MSLNNNLGLSSEKAKELQELYGKNQLIPKKKESLLSKIFHIMLEPMFLLLIIASIVYFILGEPKDGIIMLIFVAAIISIDVIQEWKTDRTLEALKDLSAPRVTVIRDGVETSIASDDLVPGDLMLVCEGVKISADGVVVKSSDLCVDESSLTGEAEGVWKQTSDAVVSAGDYWRKDYCYAGTLVTQGSGTILVDKIGRSTEYGKIGSNIDAAPDRPTPLEKQTASLVKTCAIIAGVLCVLVGVITFFNINIVSTTHKVIHSILAGITLAMAMIPEEFPVILTVFLSMGAWRLAKKSSLVRRLPSVETLGAVSVLCVDKTGTITMNQMTVSNVWANDCSEDNLLEIMGLACELDTYDPMEFAMLNFCDKKGITKDFLTDGKLITEYPFTNNSKMMGHVWDRSGQTIIAAKGSPEKILTLCQLDNKKEVEDKILQMASEGLRVIAIASAVVNSNEIPEQMTDCHLNLCGLVGLFDPPRESVSADIAVCNKAGIRVVMITGDNGITASSIARKIGMLNCDHIITGDMIESFTDLELQEHVKDTSIFSRVVPEHKMRIVQALKANNEIVAMTGDGVNDAPALKYADIGIAMGKRGSEVSREAADLVIMDDNFSTIVDTVKDGRRIYDNIRKAIGYVFSIHIPIALASLLAPLLNISSSDLFLLPIHVVLLELVIDPTCSVVLERQPADRDIMNRKPRDTKKKMLNRLIITKSVIQGIVIFLASFGTYYYLIYKDPGDPTLARTMGLVIIIFANLFLVQVNSSDSESAINSIKRLAKDHIMWIINIASFLGVIVMLYTPLSNFLKLTPLSFHDLLIALSIGFVSVMWYEVVKLFNRISRAKQI